MTLPFGTGDGREVFRYSLFLVSCNRAVAVIVAAATLAVRYVKAAPPCALHLGCRHAIVRRAA